MSTEIRPAHSPLGASGAERWMNCSGSTALIKALDLPQTDSPEYQTDGSCAHTVAELCLRNTEDAWEHIGQKYRDVEVKEEMARAVQVYLDECRAEMVEGATWGVEFKIDAPDFHKDFYGTVDFWAITPDGKTLKVKDFKYGAGIAVDVEYNPQEMYYGYGIVRRFPEIETVELTIVQPRGFHPDGPIRRWPTTAEYLHYWGEHDLRDAMRNVDPDLVAGDHCRFCPAKLVCPLLTGLFGVAMKTDPKTVVTYSDDAADRNYKMLAGVKFYIKAVEADMLARLNLGRDMSNAKLVHQKGNRVYKDGAEAVLKVQLAGDELYEKPSFKSPAQIESLGAKAKKLIHEWAYTPQTGLTVAPMSDKRAAVKVKTTDEKFGAALANLETSNEVES